jgi:RimJ/RimL family protein N-acetyltransferase
MVKKEKIKGRYVSLRSAELNDAEFTLTIRQNPEVTAYLPRLNTTIYEQIEWIKSQRKKENDYFFVVRDISNRQIGTISIYNIKEEVAESGRLAMQGNSMENIEAQLLALQFGFFDLNLKQIYCNIHHENIRAMRFIELFGAVRIEKSKLEDNQILTMLTINKHNFVKFEEKLKSLLYRQTKSNINI